MDYEQRILEIYKEHPTWGGDKITRELHRQCPPGISGLGRSTVYETLRRIKLGLRAAEEPGAAELVLRDRAKFHKGQAAKLAKKVALWEEFYATVAAMAPKLSVPKKVKYVPNPGKLAAGATLLLSDGHLNAKWGYGKTDGKTEYDFEIGCQLLNYLADEVIVSVLADRGRFGLWCLYLDILGDMLHGRLRVEDEVTNDYPTAPAVLGTAWVLYQFIRKLAEHFTTIVINCVPGNHPRLTRKPEAARYIEENMETIVYGIIKAMVAEAGLSERIQINIPNSEVATVIRLGHKIKIGHGSHVKGGGGISDIPQYGLHREVLRQYKNDQRAGNSECIKLFEYAHFHDSNLLSNLLFLNGAMCFTGPWALHHFGAYSEPTQWLYYTSEKYVFSRPNPLSLKEGKGRKHPFSYNESIFAAATL